MFKMILRADVQPRNRRPFFFTFIGRDDSASAVEAGRLSYQVLSVFLARDDELETVARINTLSWSKETCNLTLAVGVSIVPNTARLTGPWPLPTHSRTIVPLKKCGIRDRHLWYLAVWLKLLTI